MSTNVKFLKVASSVLCLCACMTNNTLNMLQNGLKCCFALLSLVSPVLLTLMLAQETFSILPQDRLGKLLSSGLKVSLYSLGSRQVIGLLWSRHCPNIRHIWGLVSCLLCALLDHRVLELSYFSALLHAVKRRVRVTAVFY